MTQKKQVLQLTVNYNSITEFLRERLKIPKNWSELSFNISSQIQKLRQDIPKDSSQFQSLRTFLKDFKDSKVDILLNKLHLVPLSYIQLQKAVQILLKQPIAKDKSIFGSYKNETVQSWSKILLQIKKQNLYMPHAAINLVKVVDYQLTSRRKNIKSNQKAIQQARVKLQGFHIASDKAKSQFQKVSINTYSIQEPWSLSDEQIRNKLNISVTADVKNIVKLYQDIEMILKNGKISTFIEYFDQYLQYFGMANDDVDLKLVRYMNRKGNTTIKFLNFYKSKRIKDIIPDDIQELEDRKYEIYESEEEKQQDLQDEIILLKSGQEQIIEVVNQQEQNEFMQQRLKTKHQKLTVLGYQETRKILINQLYESKYFLQSRIYELQPARDPQNFMIYQQVKKNKPQILLQQSQQLLKSFLEPLLKALEQLQSKQLQYLQALFKDKKHAQSKINQIMGIKTTQRKHEKRLNQLKDRCENLRTELIQIKSQYDFLNQYSQELINRMQKDMSNIFGLKIRILT